ncbi:MAG: reverse transcriptase family protein [Bacteroidota bacterium]
MSVPPRAITEQRKYQWRIYKDLRQRFGRNSDEAQAALEVYKRLNYNYRNYTKHRQAEYELKLANLIPEAPKLFHGYLRERKKGCPSVGPLKTQSGDLVLSNGGMSELFADAFSSVFVPTIPGNPHPYQQSTARMGDIQITFGVVRDILKSLSPSSSAGADGVHPSLLYHCNDVIALPLSLIIRMSMTEQELPSEWKHARVTPIFKAGSKFNPLNYRPVSVTSAPCKVAERLLANHIVSYLENNNLLNNRQFGFRKGRSTEDQLLFSYGKISREVDRGMVVDAVYLDYAKAFDVLSHSVLLAKAESIGFSPQILGWIRAFLTGRIMQVSINDTNSDSRAVGSGVPQGSVLGPLLFIVYVNSLGVDFNCEWYSFADDLKLFASKSRDASSAVDNSLQQDLNNLSEISTSWNLKLNPNKCVLIRFGSAKYEDGDHSGYTLGSSSLKLVKTHRDL